MISETPKNSIYFYNLDKENQILDNTLLTTVFTNCLSTSTYKELKMELLSSKILSLVR